MADESATQELLDFFKALADANRLKIVGLLARSPLTVEQMAEMLEIHPSTVSHHLSRLSKAGLVSARAEGYYSVYQLEVKTIEAMAQRLLERETLPAVSDSVDVDAYDRKVLRNFLTPDGRIKDFPAQEKKLEVVLRYVLKSFEPGVRYSEKQVNEILLRYHADYSFIRRSLIEYRMLAREGGGGAYWLVDAQEKV
jgi:predicted transcriptional regulator